MIIFPLSPPPKPPPSRGRNQLFEIPSRVQITNINPTFYIVDLAGRLEALASNPQSSPDILDNRLIYPFKPYGFPVVSDPVELLYSREWGEYHAHASLGISHRLITDINLSIVFHR